MWGGISSFKLKKALVLKRSDHALSRLCEIDEIPISDDKKLFLEFQSGQTRLPIYVISPSTTAYRLKPMSVFSYYSHFTYDWRSVRPAPRLMFVPSPFLHCGLSECHRLSRLCCEAVVKMLASIQFSSVHFSSGEIVSRILAVNMSCQYRTNLGGETETHLSFRKYWLLLFLICVPVRCLNGVPKEAAQMEKKGGCMCAASTRTGRVKTIKRLLFSTFVMQMLAGWPLLFQPSLFPFLPGFRYWIQVTFVLPILVRLCY